MGTVVGDTAEREIAERTHIRHNPVTGTDHVCFAGQPIPPDLVGCDEVETEIGAEAGKPAAKRGRAKAKADDDEGKTE